MSDRSDQIVPGGTPRTPAEADQYAMLIAGEALGNLDEAETVRLRELRSTADVQDPSRESLRRLADSIGLTAELVRGGLPSIRETRSMSLRPELAEKIRRDAAAYFAGNSSAATVVVQPDSRWVAAPVAAAWLGWCVAAGLAFLCAGLWFSQGRQDGPSVASSNAWNESTAAAWMNSHPDSLRLEWTVKDPTLINSPEEGLSPGSLVWDPRSQSGFMSFQTLPINDAAVQQYQLWIIDPQRDDEPIDGGVFDIVRGGETFVPIVAKLDVIAAVGFAITVEKPGGVVVSDQSRLPLLAMVP